jgi:hypothetical protein
MYPSDVLPDYSRFKYDRKNNKKLFGTVDWKYILHYLIARSAPRRWVHKNYYVLLKSGAV